MATIKWNTSAIRDIEQKMSSAVYQEGLALMQKSTPLVPIHTGALRSTDFVERPLSTGNKVSVKCGYGGGAVKVNPETGEATTDYAVKVHEDLQAHHTAGQAKFLERPANALRAQFAANMQRRVQV